MQFASALRRWRLSAGLSQEDLAERSGLSLSTISGLERGRRRAPHPGSAKQLADTLGLAEPDRASFFAMIEDERVSSAPGPPSGSPLPPPSSPTQGREREIAAVLALLRGRRWVTLVGEGGIGKTRLALEIAREAERRGRVIWLAADSLTRQAQVLPALARAAGLTERPDAAPTEMLARDLRDRPALLVLDNMEHLLESAGELQALLDAAPGSALLATSRERFRACDETTVQVDPLAIPETDDPGEISANPGVRIFFQAAPAAPGDQPSGRDLQAAARIVRILDGMPLAIELAAAQRPDLSAIAIADMLEAVGLSALGRWRDGPERFTSMEQVVRWSLDLLPPDGRTLLRLVSVFRGGFTGAAAAAVAATAGHPGAEAMLPALCRASLVREETPAAGNTRFTMLEPVRMAAASNLAASGDERRARDAHAAVFRAEATAASAEQLAPGGGAMEAVAWFRGERANLLAALAHLAASGESAAMLAMVNALGFWWEQTGAVGEGREWLARAIAADDGTPPMRDRWLARWLASLLAMEAGDYPEMRRLADGALAIAEESGDPVGMAMGHLLIACWEQTARDDLPGALERLDRATSLVERVFPGDARAWLPLGFATGLRGTYRLYGDGDSAGALADLTRSIAIYREHGPEGYAAMPLVTQAGALQALGRREEARAAVREALAIAERIDSPAVRVNAAMRLASLLSEDPGHEEAVAAARLLGALDGILERLGLQSDGMMDAENAATRARLSETLGPGVDSLVAEGRRRVEADAGRPDLLALAGRPQAVPAGWKTPPIG